ncbi:hypothetical protein TIFTF001_013332 [Ficus carica]|uniref:Uncharacterized protein n=1 Tax=Ficus carica TaxID=3494 RepID=A0AA87ZUS2_FICCA|nr:hypothetical protein TIFTF001_013332 [Ficus carica]
MDGAGGPCKSKVLEGFHGNYQHFNVSELPCSSVPPSNTRHPAGGGGGGVAVSDHVPQYMGNENPPVMVAPVRHDHNGSHIYIVRS